MKFERISKMLFSVIFFAALFIPLITMNLRPGAISVAEQRTLAEFPSIYNANGNLNGRFLAEFEQWVNDRIGFRSYFVKTYARIQYNLFGKLLDGDFYLGPQGEFNYATGEMLKDYQHLNLYTEEQLTQISDAYQVVKDFSESIGTQFYYMQCWDKHSIYPEYFPTTVFQYGDISKTDGIVHALQTQTDIMVISPKDELIGAKSSCQTYSRWGDATHWTQRGSLIGYTELMNVINEYNGNRYRVLTLNDYDITIQDQGSTFFGGIHREDMLEDFQVHNPKAIETKEKLTFLAEDRRHRFFTNETVDNDTRLLILGDSYINSFIVDDLAESFHETILIWGDYTQQIKQILEAYKPDIIVVENAERCDRTGSMINAAVAINED